MAVQTAMKNKTKINGIEFKVLDTVDINFGTAMKNKTKINGIEIKVGDILDINFGYGFSGKAKVMRIDDDDTIHFMGIGKLEKATGRIDPRNKKGD